MCLGKELDSECQSIRLSTSLQLSPEIESVIDPGFTSSQIVSVLQSEIVYLNYSQYITHLRRHTHYCTSSVLSSSYRVEPLKRGHYGNFRGCPLSEIPKYIHCTYICSSNRGPALWVVSSLCEVLFRRFYC